MSKKMKKLICALLAGAMVVSSASFAVFADADKDEANADSSVTATAEPEATTEATAAPEATEAPAEATEAPAAPTAAPVVEASKYDNDNYYAKALSLCKALGIITGYEDGSVKPDSSVTRAEMAAIILRTINSTTTTKYQNIFSDVEASHWAADTIQSASALAIINGFPGGTFQPDGDVTYEQAAKMLVCALNAKSNAEANGGYPNGYLKVAADRDILNNAQGTIGTAAERGLIIKMVYNTLLADYNEFDGAQYSASDKTLAEYAFDIKEGKGILMSTASTSLTSAKSNNGQILIAKTREEGKSVDNVEEIFETDLTNIDDLLAANITYFYQDDSLNNKKVVAIVEDASKTETVIIDNDKLEDIDEFELGTSGTGSIKLAGSKTYKIAENALVVYNGALIDEDIYSKVQSANSKSTRFNTVSKDESGKDVYTPIEYADFLKPSVGQIKLVENNASQTGYDIVFVESYETMLVTSATSKKVIGKINNASDTIDVDEDVNDLTILTTIRGMEAAPRNLKKNDVASIKRDLESETMEFVVTGESITGSVKSKSDSHGKTYVTVNGDKYEVDKNAVDDIKIGSQGIFYLDRFNRIGYTETASADGMLQSGEKYGWIINAYESETGEDKVIKLFTMEGNTVEATLAANVDFWGATDTSNSSKTKDEVFNILTKNGAINNSAFNGLDGKTATPLRLVKYKMNSSSNKLSRLYLAVNEAKVSDTNALRIDINNLRGYGGAALNGAVKGKTIPDGILEITAPIESSDMKDSSNYAVGTVTAAKYVVAEDGPNADFIMGEFDGVTVNIVVNFTASANKAATISGESGPDSAGDGLSSMVVTQVSESYDEKEDMKIYEIEGNHGGSAVKVITNKNTAYGKSDGSILSGKYYSAKTVWTAESPKGELSDYINEGDILLYSKDGKQLICAASANDAIVKAEDGTVTVDPKKISTIDKVHKTSSNSRVRYLFGPVEDSGLDDTAWVKLAGKVNDTVLFDASTSIDVVTISKSGAEVEQDAISISEIETGDYFFVAYGNKGRSITCTMIYRFED